MFTSLLGRAECHSCLAREGGKTRGQWKSLHGRGDGCAKQQRNKSIDGAVHLTRAHVCIGITSHIMCSSQT